MFSGVSNHSLIINFIDLDYASFADIGPTSAETIGETSEPCSSSSSQRHTLLMHSTTRLTIRHLSQEFVCDRNHFPCLADSQVIYSYSIFIILLDYRNILK